MTRYRLEDYQDVQSILDKIYELEKKIDALIVKLNQPSFPLPNWPYNAPVPSTPNLQWRCNVCGLESNGPLGYYCSRIDCPSGYVCSTNKETL